MGQAEAAAVAVLVLLVTTAPAAQALPLPQLVGNLQCDGGICRAAAFVGQVPGLVDGDCPAVAPAFGACDLRANPQPGCDLTHLCLTSPVSLHPCPGFHLGCWAGELVPLLDTADAYRVTIPSIPGPLVFWMVQWPLGRLAQLAQPHALDYTMCVVDPGGTLYTSPQAFGRPEAVVVPAGGVLAGSWQVVVQAGPCGATLDALPSSALPPAPRGDHWGCYPICITAKPTSYAVGIAG